MSTDKTSYIKTNKPLYIANLVARMEKNEELGTFDFERWVFGHADYAPGCELLDVACGSGKAIFKLLALHPRIGRITGVDFADSAIRMLADQTRERRLDNVEPLLLDMETLTMTLAGRRFDHLYSIYGVHYSPRLVDLLREYRALLKPGGTMFVCGPDAFSNTPLMRILGRLDAIEEDPIPMRMPGRSSVTVIWSDSASTLPSSSWITSRTRSASPASTLSWRGGATMTSTATGPSRSCARRSPERFANTARSSSTRMCSASRCAQRERRLDDRAL